MQPENPINVYVLGFFFVPQTKVKRKQKHGLIVSRLISLNTIVNWVK